jgi:DNA modification methylase
MKIISLSDVVVERRQRREIDPKGLAELQQSILTVGLLHPPVMWQRPDGKWLLSVGERRLRAIQALTMTSKSFRHSDLEIANGFIPITPLGEYLDEIGRFEAEFDENIQRAELPWQDRVQALADLHKMRLTSNPQQTLSETGAEVVKRSATLNNVAAARIAVSDAMTIAKHLDDPAIAAARNQNEALSLILKKEEEALNTELIKRQLKKMSNAPTLEIRHADLTQLLPTLATEPFDLILCDPPYGITAGSAGFRNRTVHHHNYADTADVAREIARSILAEGFRLTRPRANIFMFGAIEYFDWWKQFAANLGWTPFNRPLIWQKSESEGLAPWGSSGPRITTEFIFFATKGQKGLCASPVDVFRVKRVPRHERIHAAEKPVELLRALIECATVPGERILDPCCGSGSTLVACKESKRIGFGIEKDLTYYNTAMANVFGDLHLDV